MRREYLVFEPVFIDHDLKVDVYIFTTSQVIGFLLLLLLLQILHLQPPLLSLLLNSLYFIQWVPFRHFLSALHYRNVLNIQNINNK